MIDWLNGVMNIRHKAIKCGKLAVITPDGEVEQVIPKKSIYEGSFSTKFVLKSQGGIDEDGYSSELYFNGNPSKFLQGHNVFGSADVIGLLADTIRRLDVLADLDIDHSRLLIACRETKPTRIDFTKSLQFQNKNQVRAYIKQLSLLAHTRNGRPSQKGWTLKFNPNSRRWSLTVYSKGDEVSSNKLHPDFQEKEFVQSEADNLCRVELRLLSLELRDLGIEKLSDVTEKKLDEVYEEYVSRVRMSEKLECTPDEINSLKPSIRATYFNWRGGFDISATMAPSTFRRHRYELNKLGLDISRPFCESNTTNVVPLKQVIKAKPYEIPAEAYKKKLVFEAKPMLRAINQ